MLEALSFHQGQGNASYALQIIPSSQKQDNPSAMAAAIGSLVLDQRHPLALELVGESHQRSLLIRATTQAALRHVQLQLRARYSHVQIKPVEPGADPFRLEAGEAASMLELRAGAASYLPLQTWEANGKQDAAASTDPVLGLLAALDAIPEEMRVVAQLALVPARAGWARRYQRKAIEHALEPERREQQQLLSETRQEAGVPKTGMLLFLAGLLGILLVVKQHVVSLPSWMRQPVHELLHGQVPALSSMQQSMLMGGFIALLLLVFGGFVLFDQFRRRLFQRPVYDMRLVASKTAHAAYHVRLRLYAINPVSSREGNVHDHRNDEQARLEILQGVVAAYRQYHLEAGNYFVPVKASRWTTSRCLCGIQWRRWSWGWWSDVARSSHLMSVESVADLWHLPDPSLLPHLAQVAYRQHRSLPLPLPLAKAARDGIPLGYCEHAGHRVPFRFPASSARHHMLICGKSGEGKSTLMEHLAGDAMQQGGLLVVDPHGDLIDHLLPQVPAQRLEEVMLIDLSETDYAIGLNPLDATMGKGRDKAISDLLHTLAHIWASSWGPRMENAFEYALRTLYEANKVLLQQDVYTGASKQYTLLDVMPLLTDESFCHSLLQHISDPYILRWWHTYYEPLPLAMQRERIDPVLSKVAKFESLIARRILGQGQSTVDFAAAIREGKIILVKLAKGVIGEDTARILGATLLGLLQITLEEQATQAESERRFLPICIDEFQVLQGVDWAGLAELRKYGAAFTLATQSPEYLREMDQQLLPMVLANVKQMAVFHGSARDAFLLHKELGVDEEDILHLDSHQCYLKLTYDNHRQPTFSLAVQRPPVGQPEHSERIRVHARTHMMLPVSQVDAHLLEAIARPLKNQPTTLQERLPFFSPPSREDPDPAPEDKPSVIDADGARANGYRGRKSQEKRLKETTIRTEKIAIMGWDETVGMREREASQINEPHEEEIQNEASA
ncbi:helicase HerA domain-containing protein [Ktedonobacter robiniae]|uniref:Type IV secretion system coupling protein TraD DNA-binding domain-containing protein n=1 Tax=Ktedonobacter robiniae TaxID=2778365 RepID=A0ABQ3V229_9CHLR|nr:DUF87 domain-containing protein [Ktedonobacter robiniae]GHO59209.1 hypothetical protein KSB_76840 [Ktedonobacter robiniae]